MCGTCPKKSLTLWKTTKSTEASSTLQCSATVNNSSSLILTTLCIEEASTPRAQGRRAPDSRRKFSKQTEGEVEASKKPEIYSITSQSWIPTVRASQNLTSSLQRIRTKRGDQSTKWTSCKLSRLSMRGLVSSFPNLAWKVSSLTSLPTPKWWRRPLWSLKWKVQT